jgi:hypothetical protein
VSDASYYLWSISIADKCEGKKVKPTDASIYTGYKGTSQPTIRPHVNARVEPKFIFPPNALPGCPWLYLFLTFSNRSRAAAVPLLDCCRRQSEKQARGSLHGREGRSTAHCWHKRKYLVRYGRERTLYVFVGREVLWTAWAQHWGGTLQDPCYISRWVPWITKALQEITEATWRNIETIVTIS